MATIFNHLLFADDILIFGAYESNEIDKIFDTLKNFENMSGLKINFSKTTIHGINLDSQEISTKASLFGRSVGNWPFTYLGMPLGGNPNTLLFWNPVTEKLSKRLDKWKNATFSKGGRFTIIQSIFSNIPTYLMSIFKMPKKVIDQIEKKMRDFLWASEGIDHGSHLINWQKVSNHKIGGGLGIGNLKEKNISPASKWLWRFQNERSSMWHNIITSKYGSHENGRFTSNCTIRRHSPWYFISFCRKHCSHLFNIKIGNGRTTKFWNDTWLNGRPLKLQFSRLYNLSLAKAATVVQFWDETLNTWDINFSRNLFDREIDELLILLSLLQPLSLNDEEDKLLWSLEKDGSFTSKSHYAQLTNRSQIMDPLLYNCIWQKGAPKKIRFFVWNLTLGGLNTYDVIQRRHPGLYISPNFCCLCQKDSENHNHLFFHCPFSRYLWNTLTRTFNLALCLPKLATNSIDSLLSGHPFKNNSKILWELAVKGIVWEIWLERNYRIFKDKRRTPNEVWDTLHYKVSQWSSFDRNFCNYDTLVINLDWANFL